MPSVSAVLLIALSGAAAVASSDPTNIASYPLCVVSHPVYPLLQQSVALAQSDPRN